ncbi:thiolase family protein [Fodinicola acaciae]|uniref:thiolase family protein n=1 Tax=Fodinicola acaciae TaxID=2681555 RepID=UPI001FE6DB2F|nr:thiolase family protein [Fodinicola acaciae]
MNAVIVAARRTPIGTTGKSLRSVPADRLAAAALTATAADAALATVDDVILGNVMGPGGNTARVAALSAGFGENVPGLTVDRQCASGLEAINLAATQVVAGRGHAYLAGGVESPSTAPWRAERPRMPGLPPKFYERAPFAPAEYGDPDMGPAADALAAAAGISRQRQDEYAATSHARAVAAQETGSFDREIVPVAGCARDDRPRRGFGVGRLSRLPAAFGPHGTATAGNSCGVNDGAAVVAVVSEMWRMANWLPGLRIVDWQTAAVDPRRPGFGPVPAIQTLVKRNGLTLDDIETIEFNEAFAGQVLACLDALDLSPQRVCPDGGAIALGHPWGASGAVLVVRLFSQLIDRPGAYGLAAIASGGGLGVATLVQSVGQ